MGGGSSNFFDETSKPSSSSKSRESSLKPKTGVQSFSENLKILSEKFQIDNQGYFGRKGVSNHDYVREYEKDNRLQVAKEFFDIASKDATSVMALDKDGKIIANFDEKIYVTYRPVSHSKNGSPVVEINNVDSTIPIKYQKIHFLNVGEKK